MQLVIDTNIIVSALLSADSNAFKVLSDALDGKYTVLISEEIFQEYKSKLEEYKNKYINEYGPLYSNNVNSTDKWTWINNPWPWDKGGN